MVDIRTVEGQHLCQLTKESCTRSFDTKDFEHFDKLVRICARSIYSGNSQYVAQRRTACLENPFFAEWVCLAREEGTILKDTNLALLVDERPVNTSDTTKSKSVQEMLFQFLQRDIIFDLIVLFLFLAILNLTDTNDLLIGVVVTEDNRNVLGVCLLNLRGNILHRKTLVKKLRPTKDDTKQPLRLARRVIRDILWDNEVGLHHVSVVFDDGSLDIRVVVDLGSLSNRPQTSMLYSASELLGTLLVVRPMWFLIHGHGRGLDVRGNVQNFLDTRNTESDVLG